VKPAQPQPQAYDPLAWARQLRRREHRCERLTPAQRRMWREALKRELETENREPA
jgi:hypothetical protein